MNYYGYKFSRETDIWHHGILGQKWGKRNGPPYPLAAGKHSAAEKKAGWRQSLDKVDAKPKKSYNLSKSRAGGSNTSFSLSDKQKKMIAAGAGIVAAGLVGYGLYKMGALDSVSDVIKNGKDAVAGMSQDLSMTKIGRSTSEINQNVVNSMNVSPYAAQFIEGRNINCVNCSVGYILSQVLGIDCQAKPFYGVDEISGMKDDGRHTGPLVRAIFDNVKTIPSDIMLSSSSQLGKIPNSSTGIITISWKNGSGHALNYEKDANGILSIVDCQTGRILSFANEKERAMFMSRLGGIREIYDCSNATLRPGMETTLDYMVKRSK